MLSLIKTRKSSAKRLSAFSHEKAEILVSGYIRIKIGISESKIIPKEIDSLCLEYYFCGMPEFNCFNCTIDYSTGLIQSKKSHQIAYIIAKAPWSDNNIHHFKFKYGEQMKSSSWGVIKKSNLDNIEEYARRYNCIFAYNDRSSFAYGCNSYLATIQIVLNLKKYTISFSRIGRDAYNFGTYNLNKTEDYYFALCWKSVEETGKLQFLEWFTEEEK